MCYLSYYFLQLGEVDPYSPHEKTQVPGPGEQVD